MAQTETWTNEGIGEVIKLIAGSAASAATKIVALNKATVMTAAVTGTYGTPSDSATKHTDSGLELQAIDTVSTDTTNTTGDTITFDHVITATATKNVAGIQIVNNDGDVAYIEVGFNSVAAVEDGDTITIDGEGTLDQA